MKVIGQAHALVHQTGAPRVQTSMRVGTRYVPIIEEQDWILDANGRIRTDKKQTAADKVKRVQDLLAEDK